MARRGALALGLVALVAAAPAAAYLPPPFPHLMGRHTTATSAPHASPLRAMRSGGGVMALRCQSVDTLVQKASKAAPNTKAPTSMFKALKKKTGVKSLSYEFKRRTDIEANTQFEFDEMSYNLRVDCKPGLRASFSSSYTVARCICLKDAAALHIARCMSWIMR